MIKINNINSNPCKSSFAVQIRSCCNSTWQGTVTWVDEKRSINFRSELELIGLIDEALSKSLKDNKSTNCGSGEE